MNSRPMKFLFPQGRCFFFHSGTPTSLSAHRYSKAYPMLPPRSKMDRFAVIGNSSEPLTIVAKLSILDAFGSPQYTSDVHLTSTISTHGLQK